MIKNYYLSIDGAVKSEFEIAHSQFICHLIGLNSRDYLPLLAQVKTQYKDATHHCFAVIGSPESNLTRASDDGEPQSTAGAPMLNVLKFNQLFDVLVIVIRYFGGVKLGVGGLVNSYTKAVTLAVENAKIVKKIKSAVIEVSLTYPQYDILTQKLAVIEYKLLSSNFLQQVDITLAVNELDLEKFEQILSNISQGKVEYKLLSQEYISF